MIRTAIIGLVGAWLAAWATPASADDIRDTKVPFSADITVTVLGQSPQAGRLYAAPGMSRLEQSEPGEPPKVMIARHDLGKTYVLDTEKKTYTELVANDRSRDPWNEANVKLTPAGSETINGMKATKYALESTGGFVPITGFIWRTADGIVVKSETQAKPSGSHDRRSAAIEQMVQGMKQQTELRNVKVGPQNAALFEPPADYRKEELPFGRPRQRP